jgi:predicted HAD superfamily phosphohydrolase
MLVQLEVDDESLDRLMVRNLSDTIPHLCPKEDEEIISAIKTVCGYFSVEGVS